MTNWDDEKECLKAVKRDGFALKYVENQTPEICLEAVKQCGQSLEYVKSQTPEICLAAVKENEWALQHVNKKFYTSDLKAFILTSYDKKVTLNYFEFI